MSRILLSIFLYSAFVYYASAQQEEGSFQNFWSDFRSAVISGDKERISSLTKFPFEVRGPNDSDPVIRHNRSSFMKIYDRLLTQQVYSFDGAQVNPKPMREIIESKTRIAKSDILAEDFVRIEKFTFAKVKDRWLFIRAYIESP
jgi:hypothetical protein